MRARLKFMRGNAQAQPDFLTVINLNQCVPADPPLRAIKRRVDAVLQKLSPLFDELYADEGRASIPPGQRLKARVLTALYRVRSERLFCGQLACNLLWPGSWTVNLPKAVSITAFSPKIMSGFCPPTWPNSFSPSL